MNSDPPAPLEPGTALPGATRPPPVVAGTSTKAQGGRNTIRSADLLGGATTVEIEHLGQIYRLQTTRSGKLILTK